MILQNQDLVPQTVEFNPTFRKKISRLFLFRFLRIFVAIWPIYVWMIRISIIGFLHFWYKLILGKRHEGFWKREVRFMRHMTKWGAYIRSIIDLRPKFIED